MACTSTTSGHASWAMRLIDSQTAGHACTWLSVVGMPVSAVWYIASRRIVIALTSKTWRSPSRPEVPATSPDGALPERPLRRAEPGEEMTFDDDLGAGRPIDLVACKTVDADVRDLGLRPE